MIQITPAYDADKSGYPCRHLKRLKQTTHIQVKSTVRLKISNKLGRNVGLITTFRPKHL